MLSKWISLHVYCLPPYESLLRNTVLPAFEYLGSLSIIDRAFFVRYFEDGPHLRIRVRLHSIENYADIEKWLTGYFRQAIEVLSSQTVADVYAIYGDQDTNSWCHPGTIRSVNYEPEIDRYGGDSAIELAECHFHLSSSCILELLRDEERLSQGKRLGIAIQMQLALFFAFRFSREQLLRMLGAIDTHENVEFYTSKQADSWYDAGLLSDIVTTWNSMGAGTSFQSHYMNYWLAWSGKIADDYRRLFQQGKIQRSQTKEFERDCADIVLSLGHMNCNRLGITNYEEAAIYQLLFLALN